MGFPSKWLQLSYYLKTIFEENLINFVLYVAWLNWSNHQNLDQYLYFGICIYWKSFSHVRLIMCCRYESNTLWHRAQHALSIFYLIWHVRTSPYFCIIIAGVEQLHQPDPGPTSMITFQVFKTLSRCHHHLVPLEELLIEPPLFHNNAAHCMISLNLCSARRTTIRCCCPFRIHLCPRRSCLPSSKVLIFPFFIEQLSPFILEEVKLTLLIVSYMAFLLSPFPRGSHLDASQLLPYS